MILYFVRRDESAAERGGVGVANAKNLLLFRYLYLHVPQRAPAAALSCLLWRVRALINIQTLEVIDGGLTTRALRLVREWAELHRDELMQDWELARNKQALMKIESLE